LVGGAKMGLLKYIGRTDFAKGIWAGIELDDAIGKNDGAVAGKRYVMARLGVSSSCDLDFVWLFHFTCNAI